jgi:hypothetical protein
MSTPGRRHLRMARGLCVLVLVPALALCGCGGSSPGARTAAQVSLPAYGSFPATTIAGSPASARVCRANAQVFARDAVDFLAHFGPAAAYPADLNLVIVREDLGRLETHGCDPRALGDALARTLTPSQRSAFMADLPTTMARTVRESLRRAGD